MSIQRSTGQLPEKCQLYARYSVSHTQLRTGEAEVRALVRERLTRLLVDRILSSKMTEKKEAYQVDFGMDLIVMERDEFMRFIEERTMMNAYGARPFIV